MARSAASGMALGAGRLRIYRDFPAGSNGHEHCAQPSIGIDEHDTGIPFVSSTFRTIDVVDVADLTFLAKATVHTTCGGR